MRAPFLPILVLATMTSVVCPAWADDGIPAVAVTLEKFISDKEIAGAVTYVGDSEGTRDLSVVGLADLASGRPMTAEAIFWIASMTKPVTGTAVMMLHEAGLLSVDDPVSKHLPEFKDLKGPDGKPASVTIRQCLSHTSGLSDVRGPEAAVEDLESLMPAIVSKPLRFDPGSKWEYNQASINTAARVVEVVSGKSFPEFLDERLFGPLGMKDTTFYLNEEQAARLATSYRKERDALEVAPLHHLGGKSPTSRDRYPLANGGLFSTAADYAQFARMILRGGELGGRRYLKEETVKQMTAPTTDALQTGFTPGNAWGIGWCVVREPQGVTATLSPGSFGHGGAFGTQAWIDPAKDRFYLLFVQRANFPNSDASDLRGEFQKAAAPRP
jgi:CubicO group peptidase (beta-lactamase class C family)